MPIDLSPFRRRFAMKQISVRQALNLLVLACLIPATIAGIGLIRFLYQEDREYLQRDLLLTSRALALAVDRDFESAMARATTLAASPALLTDDLPGFYRQALVTPLGNLGINVMLNRPDGQQVLNTARPFGDRLPPHGSPPQLRKTLSSGAANVSDLYTVPGVASPQLTVETPVRRDDRTVYVLSIGIHLNQLAQIIRDQKLPPKWFVSISDTTGTIAARSHEAERFIGHKVTPALLARLPQADDGVIETETLEGVSSVVAFARAPNTRWVVALGVPVASLEAGLYRTVGWAAAAAAAMLGAGLLLATILGKRIAASVTALCEPAAALGRGEPMTPERLPLLEADTVMKALEEAGSLLADRTAERDQAREELEARVEERTSQLRDALARSEAATQAKSDFLSNMSHEIRTPLNAITGLTALMLDSGPNPSQREYLDKIRTSTATLLGILNDILDYSKIEAGRLDLEATDFDLEAVLQNTAGLFTAMVETKGTELFLDIAPDAPTALIGDPLRLGQVLSNLIGNAVKFTQRGEIHVKVETVAKDSDRVSLRFTIRDTGIGMSAEQTARLFQPFAQADQTISRRFGGTGLGLTIAQRLASLMGGGISVESEQGRGSVFRFDVSFPIATRPERRDLGQLDGMRVLVVDDQETSLMIMRTMLEAWGGQVTTISEGARALELIATADSENHPFELIIIDWRMPVMDGVSVARAIQRAVAMNHLRPPSAVMLMTAHDREALKSEIHAVMNTAAIDDILPKPVTQSVLFNAISRRQHGNLTVGIKPILPSHSLTQAIRGTHILLVEDNDINQMVGRELLSRAGLVVTVAANGQEAIDWVRRTRFDAVLMDLQMPVMDGLEAARRIRRMPVGYSLPIIAMTAAALPEDKIAAREAGMNDHISKPISPEALAGTLLKWIKPRSPLSLQTAVRPSDTANGVALPLPTITGIDARQLELRLGDNPVLLRTLLQRMAAEFRNVVNDIRRELADGHPENAAFRLHTLKGVSANLAAVTAATLAGQAEAAIKDNALERVPPLLDQLEENLIPLMAGIDAYMAETASPVS